MIAVTTIRKGLKVRAAIDPTPYPKGIKVTDTEFAAIQLNCDDFHEEWNYVISPKGRCTLFPNDFLSTFYSLFVQVFAKYRIDRFPKNIIG